MLVLAPLIPAALCIAAGVRWLDGLEEPQRRIQLNALAFVFPGLLGIAVSVELLRAAGLLAGLAWSFRSLGIRDAVEPLHRPSLVVAKLLVKEPTTHSNKLPPPCKLTPPRCLNPCSCPSATA